MADTSDLLFELGTEELPPKSLLKLRDALRQNVESGLAEAGLDHGAISAYATPRRLALLIRNLVKTQPDRVVDRRGPALAAAFNADGTPSKAAQGFAKSCGTAVDQLGRLETEKGEWLAFQETVRGESVQSLIPQILHRALSALPIARRMRWGSGSTEFVRPVHWAVLIYGASTLEAEILGVMTGNSTRGHRFHHPEAIEIPAPANYAETLKTQGYVIADFDERRSLILKAAEAAAQSVGGIAHIEDELLDEVTALNEWPVAVVGSFEAGFLNLPPEVLITTMQSNQKYFPVKNEEGHLLHHFITFSNIESRNPAAVREGNERVIRPRLTDAEFFWTQDRKASLESRIDALNKVIFQQKLGTLGDKSKRVEQVARHIARLLGADVTLAARAAQLAKADLLTEMVGEFPNLQGTMGRYYALADGEPAEVAWALEEQYEPRQSGGELPNGVTGQILSLAEKLDTLSGIFSIGLTPSGDKDPYALRRAALGALRILIEKALDLDLMTLLDFSLERYSHNFDHHTVRHTLLEFMLDRLKSYFLDRGYSPDEFDAVAAVLPTNPLDFESRLRAVREFRRLPESESLAAANKRIRNILRKAEEMPAETVEARHLTEEAEIRLLQYTLEAADEIAPLLQQRDYTPALSRLALLRETVDRFFDHVMVMTEDEALRRQRLGLLALLESQFSQIADISRLQPSQTA